jgi:hypothetical protein
MSSNLKILKHKQWHVWKKDNITKVRKDEKEYEEKLEKEKKKQDLNNSERKLEELRKKKNIENEIKFGKIEKKEEHVNFFQDFDDQTLEATKNEKIVENDKKEGVGFLFKDPYLKVPRYDLIVNDKPIYDSPIVEFKEKVEHVNKNQKKTIEEMRRDRLKREEEEKKKIEKLKKSHKMSKLKN